MPIKVSCPGCKSRYQVAERFAGQATQCTKCQATISIPAAAAAGSMVRQAQQAAVAGATATMTRTATAVAPAPAAGDWMSDLPPSQGAPLAPPAAAGQAPPRKKKQDDAGSSKEDLLFKLLVGNMALNVVLVIVVVMLLLRGPGSTAVASQPQVAAAIPPTQVAVQQPVQIPVQQPVVQQPVVQQPVQQPPTVQQPVQPDPQPAIPTDLPAGAAGFRLQGNGSSFINPMMQTWISVYTPPPGGSVSYQSTGSGKGIENSINKISHFGCSDAPMTPAQLEQARGRGGEVLHIPLAMGAVVAGYNLPDSPQLKFTGALLADIFLGNVTKWDDPAIAGINPGVTLPDLPIAVVYRSDKSGTTFLWTDYLSKVSLPWKQQVGVGTEVKFPVGEGRPQNEGVANHVKRTVGAIGYFELGFALANRLRYGQVQNRAGKFVEPSLQSTTAAAGGLKQIPEDLCFSLTDTEGPEAYPICGACWAMFYVNQPPGQGDALLAFIRWITHEGQAHCRDLNYAPLAESVVAAIDKKLALVQVR